MDIGSLNTRAALFDVVGDEYRFVAARFGPDHSKIAL